MIDNYYVGKELKLRGIIIFSESKRLKNYMAG
jgi:hypothetical protein